MNSTNAAAVLLAQMLVSPPGWNTLHTLDTLDGKQVPRVLWHDATDWRRLAYRLDAYGYEFEPAVGVVPYMDQGSFRLYGRSAVVWARVETPAQLRALERFHPGPTLMLRDGGSRATALWALRRQLPSEDAERVSRHMQHHLGAPKKHAACSFEVPSPLSVLRDGRKKPVPVTVERCDPEAVYSVGEVCRSLPRRIPDPLAWRK